MITKLFSKLRAEGVLLDMFKQCVMSVMSIYGCGYLKAARMSIAIMNAFIEHSPSVSPVDDDTKEVDVSYMRFGTLDAILCLPELTPHIITHTFNRLRGRVKFNPSYYNALSYWSLPGHIRKRVSEEMDRRHTLYGLDQEVSLIDSFRPEDYGLR